MSPTFNSNGIKTSTVFRKSIPIIPGLAAPITAAALEADDTITEPPEIVCRLIHQGTKCMIAGGSKVGKTLLGLDLAVSVATGSRFLNWNTVKGKVLFINFELLPGSMKRRYRELKARRQIDPGDNLVIWNVRGKSADFGALLEHIIQFAKGKGFVLIILDPIYKAMVGKAEGTASSVGLVCNQLERLAVETGAAIVYMHHFPKGNAKKKAAIDRMAGSGVFARDADTIITLTDHETLGCFTVEMILRNLPEHPAFVVQRDYPVMVVREDLDPEDVEVGDDGPIDTDEGVMALLELRPLRSCEWQAAALQLGVGRNKFYKIKAKLKDEGLVRFDLVTKTWSLPPVVEVSPAGTNGTQDEETKLLGWPDAGAVGGLPVPPAA
jgi:hypothetical protein